MPYSYASTEQAEEIVISAQDFPSACKVVLKGVEHLKNKSKETLDEKDVVINPRVTFDISQSRNSNLGANLEIEGIDKSEYDRIFKSYKDIVLLQGWETCPCNA